MRQFQDPNAMDTSAGRTCRRVTGSEEMNLATMPRGGYIPHRGTKRKGRNKAMGPTRS